jgi:hypothetical protein
MKVYILRHNYNVGVYDTNRAGEEAFKLKPTYSGIGNNLGFIFRIGLCFHLTLTQTSRVAHYVPHVFMYLLPNQKLQNDDT